MNTKGKKLAIAGSILLLAGPLFGLLGTIIGMLSAFQTMGSEGSENAEALASDIGFSLITTTIGLCIGIIGGTMMLIALFVVKYRAPWFFWYYAIMSILGLFNFPLGTILGSLMLVYLITHRDEFKNKTEPESGAYLDNAG
jgi:biopolymer transport protein ExbB